MLTLFEKSTCIVGFIRCCMSSFFSPIFAKLKSKSYLGDLHSIIFQETQANITAQLQNPGIFRQKLQFFTMKRQKFSLKLRVFLPRLKNATNLFVGLKIGEKKPVVSRCYIPPDGPRDRIPLWKQKHNYTCYYSRWYHAMVLPRLS